MNQTLKIFTLISIKDNHFRARYEAFTETTGDTRVITYSNESPIHNDLYEAMQRLGYHVVGLTGLVAMDDAFVVTGYQRQNTGNAQLLTIYVRLENDSIACGNLAARFYIGRDEYESIDLLLEDLSTCEREALAYIEVGKRLEHNAFIYLNDDDLTTLQTAA